VRALRLRSVRPGAAGVGLLSALAVLLVGAPACDGFDAFQFATFDLRDGTVGEVYADTIRTVGARGEVTFRLVDGQLPPGVGLREHDRNGILYGRPTREGDFLFTVEARDEGTSWSEGAASARARIVTQGFAITVTAR